MKKRKKEKNVTLLTTPPHIPFPSPSKSGSPNPGNKLIILNWSSQKLFTSVPKKITKHDMGPLKGKFNGGRKYQVDF